MSLVPDYDSGSSNDESTDSDKESDERLVFHTKIKSQIQ